jgi:hypothetical protein
VLFQKLFRLGYFDSFPSVLVLLLFPPIEKNDCRNLAIAEATAVDAIVKLLELPERLPFVLKRLEALAVEIAAAELRKRIEGPLKLLPVVLTARIQKFIGGTASVRSAIFADPTEFALDDEFKRQLGAFPTRRQFGVA